MNRIYAVMIVIVVLVALVCFIAFLATISQSMNKIVEESNCNQLLQFIKDRGNNTPPRHDRILSKWVALECWK